MEADRGWVGVRRQMTEPQSGVKEGGEPLRRWDPERIGPYVILGRLGAGAMGQVYLGRSAAGRLVAVKTIKVELAEEAGFRTRFAPGERVLHRRRRGGRSGRRPALAGHGLRACAVVGPAGRGVRAAAGHLGPV